MKLCSSGCGRPVRDERHRHCLQCHAETERKRYARMAELVREAKAKQLERRQVKN